MQKNQYYSLVSDRISELEKNLKNLEKEILLEKDTHKKEVLNLKIEIIKNKIKKLKDIELLPLYISISHLSNADIYEMETKSHITFSELQEKLHLNKVKSVMNEHKIVTLSYLKEIFVDDIEAMNDLIKLQDINFMCTNKLVELSNFGPNSIAQLNISLKTLSKLEEKVNPILRDLENDYSFTTLKEINHYMNNKNKKLPREFILKHKDKVLLNNKEMEKVVNKLSKKESFISKLFKNKRNKNEEKFIKCVVESYKNDNRLSMVGLNPNENLLDNSHNMKKFIKNLSKKITIKRTEIDTLKNETIKEKNKTMNEIKYYQELKENKRKDFISLLKEKSSFLPKMFAEQLWNEPNLKESLFKVAYLKEEQTLIDTLNAWNPPTIKVMDNVKVDVNIRKLTA